MTNETISNFRAGLRGKLVQPTDAAYNTARKVYNGMIDKYPAMICECADVADIIACVHFARENNMLLAVRGGGHNAGGLVIDLSGMKAIKINHANKSKIRSAQFIPGESKH